MSVRLFLPSAVALTSLFFGSLASAQATANNNPSNKPDVFLDNHRPVIKKKDKAPTSRDVSGKVVDIGGQPIEGALVTLTNTKTNSKVTFITKSDGRYNFDDLSFTIDYELQAKFKNVITDTRRISQYDHNPSVVRILEMDDTKSTAKIEEAKQGEAKKENPPK